MNAIGIIPVRVREAAERRLPRTYLRQPDKVVEEKTGTRFIWYRVGSHGGGKTVALVIVEEPRGIWVHTPTWGTWEPY